MKTPQTFHQKMLHLLYINLWMLVLFFPFSTSLAIAFHMSFCIFSIYFFVQDFKSSKLFLTSGMIFFMLFTASITLSTLITLPDNIWPLRSFGKIRYLVLGVFGIYGLRALVKEYLTPKKIALLISAIFITHSLETILSYLGYFTNFDFFKFKVKNYEGRFSGAKGIMQYSYETPFITLSALSLYLHRKKLKNLPLSFNVVLFTFIVTFLGVLFCNTRGGIIGMILALPFACYYYQKKWAIWFGAMVTFLAGIILVINFSGGLPGFGRIMGKSSQNSNVERMEIYTQTIKSFQARPIWGWGLIFPRKDYPVHFHGYINPLGDSHSTYLQVLGDGGLVGITLYILFLFFWLKNIYALPHEVLKKLLIPCFVFFVTSSSVHTELVTGVSSAVIILLVFSLSTLFPKST